MPRTALAVVQQAANASATATEPAADQPNGNSFVNDGRTILIVKNGDASARTCTVKGVACSHGRTADIVKAVSAGATEVFPMLDKALYNQSDGTVNVDWSASTPSTVKATPVSLATY